MALVDLMLPDGNGTDVVREIKASYPETLVAVLSSVRDLSGPLRAGADEALGKAVSLPEIVSWLADLAAGGATSPGGRTSWNPLCTQPREQRVLAPLS